MIVKIQRPFSSSEPEPQALVYNQSRSFRAFMPMTPAIEALFKRGALKVYHHAELDGDRLLIGKAVKGKTF